MRDYSNIIISILVFIWMPILSSAQVELEHAYYQPLQDVFLTELVYPQEKHEVQLTVAPIMQRSDQYRHILLPFVAEYGITDRWQLELEWNSYQRKYINSDHPVSGIGDLEIGTRYSFMNISQSNFHTALGFGVRIPVGDADKGLSEEGWEFEPSVMLANDFPGLNHSQVFAQLGFGLETNGEDEEATGEEEGHEMSFGCGFFVPFDRLIFTSELNWYTTKWNGGDESKLYYTPGMVFNLPGGWEAGVGLPIGLNDQSDKFWLIAMLTFEFNLAEDDD